MMNDDILKNTHKLVRAVFANDFLTIKQIIEKGNFNHLVLDNVFAGLSLREIDVDPDYGYKFEENEPVFPLFYITLCNNIYLNGWGNGNVVYDTITSNHIASLKIVDYWRKLGYPVDDPIDFSKYVDLIKPYEWTEFELIMDEKMEVLLNLGYNEKEINLCYAIKTYDRNKIFELLEKGVNPDVYISNEYKPNECPNPMEECKNGYETIYDQINDPICPGSYYDYLNCVDYDNKPLLRIYPFYCAFSGAAYTEIADKIKQLKDQGIL